MLIAFVKNALWVSHCSTYGKLINELIFFAKMFYFSPSQESQQIFKATSPIDTEQIKTKVCDSFLYIEVKSLT
jgi:hypothetical protein